MDFLDKIAIFQRIIADLIPFKATAFSLHHHLLDKIKMPVVEGGKGIASLIADAAEPLPDLDAPEFGAFFDRFADRRIVLLGEATHGTSEFYRARAAISRHLISRHGFNFVAVEADWPDAASFNRYVRHWGPHANPRAVFQRFPTWMWRNLEVDELLHWMRAYNTGRAEGNQAGFYGLDLYNMSASIAEVLAYLGKVDPEAQKVAKERYGCLEPWKEDPAMYGRASLARGYGVCEKGVVRQCRELFMREQDYRQQEGAAEFLDAAQNARLVEDAEKYYRVMYHGGAESWNLRDTHMFNTLDALLKWHGPDAKAIVWAHNSHIGDARYTDMGERRKQLNIGQLCRQKYGDHQCALIGFGTHAGTVACADEWGEDMQIKRVRPSMPESVERLCHDSQVPRFLLDLHSTNSVNAQVRRALLEPARLERFIGVIYRPDTERWSHYSPSLLPEQFDAYVWFDQTEAVTPWGPQHAKPGMAETYPFGL